MTQPNQSELDSQSTRNREDKSELRANIHSLFGDYQAVDGEYCSSYDGKWIDMTNEVVSVADYMSQVGPVNEERYSNCCGATDIYDGNLDNNEGVCADCGEHCEMED